MSADESFLTLKTFFETRNAARQALGALDESVEIGIVIGEMVDCALFRRGSDPVVERRAARNPDVVFHIKPESVIVLNDRTKDEIGDIGINILKEVLAGNIRVSIPGSILNLARRGYVEMISRGGPPVAAFLARHGISSVPKIVNAIKRMKS